MTQVDIPNRSLFRQPEVCAIASIQPYVLRSWEAEFPDLGVAKTAGGPRVYRRADVERVLRIKQLLYGEGLTLAGVRRKLTEEAPAAPAEASEINLTELMGEDARERILLVKRGLRELSLMLSHAPGTAASQGFLEGRQLTQGLPEGRPLTQGLPEGRPLTQGLPEGRPLNKDEFRLHVDDAAPKRKSAKAAVPVKKRK